MSRENVELVLRLFERPRDPTSADLFADDITLSFHGEARGALGDGVVGKPAVTNWFVDWFSQFERDYRFEVHEVEDWGDRVCGCTA